MGNMVWEEISNPRTGSEGRRRKETTFPSTGGVLGRKTGANSEIGLGNPGRGKKVTPGAFPRLTKRGLKNRINLPHS